MWVGGWVWVPVYTHRGHEQVVRSLRIDITHIYSMPALLIDAETQTPVLE